MAIPPVSDNTNEDFNAPPQPISSTIPKNQVDDATLEKEEAEPVDLSGVNQSLREATPNIAPIGPTPAPTESASSTIQSDVTPVEPTLTIPNMQDATPIGPVVEPIVEQPIAEPIVVEPTLEQPVVEPIVEPIIPQEPSVVPQVETPVSQPIETPADTTIVEPTVELAGTNVAQTEVQTPMTEEMHPTLGDGLLEPQAQEVKEEAQLETKVAKKGAKGLFILLFFLVLILLGLIGILAFVLLS